MTPTWTGEPPPDGFYWAKMREGDVQVVRISRESPFGEHVYAICTNGQITPWDHFVLGLSQEPNTSVLEEVRSAEVVK